MTATCAVEGVVVRGHGVASGESGDPRFPAGTLRLQFPIFARLGVDLEGMHPGTINVDLDGGSLDAGEPDHVLRAVRWHEEVPAEDFSFWRITLIHSEKAWPALIYRPHPETKPEHHQPDSVVEVLAPFIADLDYGHLVTLVHG